MFKNTRISKVLGAGALLLLQAFAWAEGLDAYPGWELNFLQTNESGKRYYRLVPPNGTMPITIDEISAQRLLNGEMGPSAVYNSMIMSAKSSSDSDFVYSAKNVGVTMANTTGAATSGTPFGAAGGAGSGAQGGSNNSGMESGNSGMSAPPGTGFAQNNSLNQTGAGGGGGSGGGGGGTFNVDPDSPFAAIYQQYAGSAALNGGRAPGGSKRAPSSAGGSAADEVGAKEAQNVMLKQAGVMNSNQEYNNSKNIMERKGNMNINSKGIVPQAEYDLHGFSCEYARTHNAKAYSFMGCK